VQGRVHNAENARRQHGFAHQEFGEFPRAARGNEVRIAKLPQRTWGKKNPLHFFEQNHLSG
jgi:hypothetical protein